LSFIGRAGQEKLSSSVLGIVGCGALGSVSAELLVRAGVGKVVLVDHDVVDMTNLQRQALYTEEDMRKPKASCLKHHLSKINSSVVIVAHDVNLDFENISSILGGVNLVLDCTDNIDARLLLNEFCSKSKLPWIHSAAVEGKGVVLNFLPRMPCFTCVFPGVLQGGSCEELGILNSASHITSSIQVVEAIKMLLGKPVIREMLRIDVLNHNIEKIKVKHLDSCEVCKGKYAILEGRSSDAAASFTIKECKTKKGMSVKQKKNVKLDLEGIKKEFKLILDASILLVIECEGEIVVHGYGELLFKDLKDVKRIKDISDRIYKAGGL